MTAQSVWCAAHARALSLCNAFLHDVAGALA